jgi:hypothetical protein
MTGFSVDWLHLREPFDRAARKAAWGEGGLAKPLARWCRQRAANSLAAIDLACGLGANLRELAPRLGGAQHWRLVDHDPVLLAAVPRALEEWAHRHDYRFTCADDAGSARPIEIIGSDFHAEVVLQQLDLARNLANLEFRGTHLVTASALLDLVSAPWLRTLLRKAQADRCAMWFALSVDGRAGWEPPDPEDERVHRLFSRHQRRDKGFGDALGPRAAAFAMQEIAGNGYESLQVQTDWVIDGAQAPDMQLAMIEGIASAALEQDPGSENVVRSWKARRSAAVGGSHLRVGHVDILATPL